VSDPAALGLTTAFAAGLVSFLSPCVLPLVPAYLSYVAGQSLHRDLRDAPTDPRARGDARSGAALGVADLDNRFCLCCALIVPPSSL
jgi:cytochrome c biogenesis protein CcdA